VLGILVFLGGIALLLQTFKLAYDMFAVPPSEALGVKDAKVLEPVAVGNSLAAIAVRIVLLLIMGIVGSLVANKGVALYFHSCDHTHHPRLKTEPAAEPSDGTI
jgi:hypothetical protein